MLVKGEICIFTKNPAERSEGSGRYRRVNQMWDSEVLFFVLFLYVFFVEVQEINDI